MPLKLEFMDWHADRPGLAAAAELLLERYRRGNTVDLQTVLIAVPGQGAGRRLLEVLVTQAEDRALVLVPPRVITVGALPETLYAPKRPFADDLTQQLAWVQAVQAADERHVRRVIPQLPARDDLPAWLAIGELLSQLHRELAGDQHNFQDVAERGRVLAEFNESERWLVLADIQRRYHAVLDDLQLWDRQTARLEAVKRLECHTEDDIYLLGTVDLNETQRAMLDQVADRVTALVCAPPALADRFDEHGCLRPAAWQDVLIPVDTEQIEIVAGPGDQADAVMRTIAGFQGRYSAEEITIGVPDELLVPYLQQRFAECELPARHGAGRAMAHTAPYRLLDAIAEFLESRRFASFAALVRHPDVAHWLAAREITGDWITDLDNYHRNHLPGRLTDDWLRRADGSTGLQKIKQAVARLLEPLLGGTQSLTAWSEPILNLLIALWDQPQASGDDAERIVLAVCDAAAEVLQGFRQLPPPLAPRVTAGMALRLMLRKIGGERIPPRADHSSIELVGWLELPLDDAPALIVTGFNEGLVPGAHNADLFLPNELRRQLRVEDNERIYARDAYALSVLAASRRELRIIAGRRSAENEPLAPSRLLFACDDRVLAERASKYFAPPPTVTQPVRWSKSLRAGSPRARFVVPLPRPLPAPVTSMRVTEFRDYIVCPYRYYLKHRLKLQQIDDAAEELGADGFGSLLHDVLKDFGAAHVESTHAPGAGEIFDQLGSNLDRLVRSRYGHTPRPAVSLQVEQARLRLRSFSEWQARWFREGWRILCVEQAIQEQDAHLMVDGTPMFIHGRIDRIDVRDGGRPEFLIFDYKTGDAAKKPEDTHLKRDQWIDLQLPLYRHLVAQGLELQGDVRLGYIVVPREVEKTGDRIANWTPEQLAEADAAAAQIIRGIRAEDWPRTSPAPSFFEQFAAICQDSSFGEAGVTGDEEET